jgi:hypothetical protein
MLCRVTFGTASNTQSIRFLTIAVHETGHRLEHASLHEHEWLSFRTIYGSGRNLGGALCMESTHCNVCRPSLASKSSTKTKERQFTNTTQFNCACASFTARRHILLRTIVQHRQYEQVRAWVGQKSNCMHEH